MEAGLRISPETWSTQLYGTTNKKSEMQSIIDKVHVTLLYMYMCIISKNIYGMSVCIIISVGVCISVWYVLV